MKIDFDSKVAWTVYSVVIVALFLYVAFALSDGIEASLNRIPTKERYCYAMLSNSYKEESRLIDSAMADGILSKRECNDISNAVVKHLDDAEEIDRQNLIARYHRVRAGQSVPPEDE